MAKKFEKKTVSEILMSKTINDLNTVTNNIDSDPNWNRYKKDIGSYCSSCGGNGTVHICKSERGVIKSICTKCGKIFINYDENFKERKNEFKGVKCPNCGNEDINSLQKYGKYRYSVQRYKCNKCGRYFIKESDYKNT